MYYIEPKVHAVFIHVTDLKRSAAWYSKLLNLPFDEKEVSSPVYNLPVTGDTYVTLDDHAFDPNFSFQRSAHPAFNFLTDDLLTTYEKLVEDGVQVVREIEKVDNFGWFHIADPDENVIMICGTV